MSEKSPDQQDQGAQSAAVSPPLDESPRAASNDIPAAATAAAAAATGHENAFPGTSAVPVPAVAGLKVAQPSTFLQPLARPRAFSRPMTPSQPLSAVDKEQIEGLRAIRAFLKVRTSYDVLPLSFRLIIFDQALLVKKSLNILMQNGIVSAPLWDSTTSTFAGMLTTSDYINVIQYYWQNPHELETIDQFRLDSLRDIERAIGAPQIETVSIHPERPVYEACRMMLASRARRIPIIDIDDETRRPMVVSVITQYRILKFVAVNVKETEKLQKPLKDLEMKVGSYENLQTATMDTPVIEVIHMLVKKNISSVPILDKDGTVINVFEAVDVIALIKGGEFDELDISVGEALLKRPDDFAGIYTCTMHDRLDTIFDTIRKSRVHRLVIIDENSHLKGVLTLSDILSYVLLEGEDDDERSALT
ncbi:hypothetical protein FKW77_004943 [Venturia effusa]|uniref:CBS domain-containing protein n=1 Tax=Venturia effusa TaxID=50376 RepID=A0A517LK53_9PEZI|nr:hypothetical protein FKW77_004943 [Venturia effusa]